MKRFEIWLARLDPAKGSEMRKTRPVVIVSPHEMNARLLSGRVHIAVGPEISSWRG
jgi:mRNA-degrading endonuclease toxin of MazEF toxin-antitoxin module